MIIDEISEKESISISKLSVVSLKKRNKQKTLTKFSKEVKNEYQIGKTKNWGLEKDN